MSEKENLLYAGAPGNGGAGSSGSYEMGSGGYYYPPGVDTLSTPFKYGPRQSKDWMYAVLFFMVLIGVAIGGGYGVAHRNRHFEEVMDGSLNMTLASSCPAHPKARLDIRYGLVLDGDNSKPEFDSEGVIRVGAFWVFASLLVSVLLGCLLVAVFIKKSMATMKFTVAVQVGTPLVTAFLFLGYGQFGMSILFFVITGLNALCFYCYRRQLALCTKLLEVAACGLRDNHMLVPTVLLLKLLSLVVVVPTVGAGFVAITNGSIEPNPYAIGTVAGGTCVDPEGMDVTCCTWQTDPWVAPFLALCVFSVVWTYNLVFEMRLLTSSSAIVQWYYTPVGMHRQGKAISLGLYHAFGPHFGTCCYGGLVLTAVDYLRQMSNNLRTGRSDNGGIGEVICRWILAMMIDCVSAMIEFLTKFSTITSAITGDGLCDAARSTYDLLTRNFLSTLSVWWIPNTVLGVMCFTISIVWTFISFLILWAFHSNAMHVVIVVSVLTFVFTFVALSFVATMLTLAVDVCYVCYALDLDTQQQGNKDVHEVFDMVRQEQPEYKQRMVDGPIISQPGGGYAYGA